MDITTAFSIIGLAALIHASFQLGVSMVTLLSGHAVGKKFSSRRVVRLVGSFFLGTVVMTALILSIICDIVGAVFQYATPTSIWTTLTLAMVVVGLVIWVCYYRRGPGTLLWVPRGMAKFLHTRIHATRDSAEAFSLGLTSVLAELFFIITPAAAATLAIVSLPASLQLLGAATYVVLASFGMFTVTIFISSGHNISQLQRWRETNKRFLQFTGGSALIILACYMYVTMVMSGATLW